MSSSQARTARATRATVTATAEDGRTGPTAEGGRTGPTAEGGRTGPTAVTRRGQTTGSPPAPTVLDRYRLVRRLGSGAFGTVWMARDERLERDVAVKILARERIVGGRFEREARAAARLTHPAIVTLYEAAVDDEGAYLVSELVRGSTLDGLLQQGRLSDRDILSIGIALCEALDHAHGQGVVHRDVKPSNVLIPDAPASVTHVAKLTDFGVARVVGTDSLTRTGDVIGTLAYMAPEQAEGMEAGPAADLYSLALVLYEALTGVNPLALNATQRSRRLGTRLPPVRRQRRELPHELGAGIDLALRPRPRERGTVAELRRALELSHDQVGDEPGVVAAPVTPWTTLLTRRADEEQGDTSPASERDADAHENGVAWPPRAAAALAAAGLTAWLAGHALSPAPVTPALAGLLAAGLTLLLPRTSWLLLMIGLAATAALQHQPGMSLLLLIALTLPLVLLPRRPTLWPVAAGAPALGLLPIAGLAGAWPALAARAGSPWRRAALGAIGWIWLLLATPLAHRTLYLASAGPPTGWGLSAQTTVDQVLRPLTSTAVLAPALVWALAAAVLPWLVRGRNLTFDVIRVVVWSSMVISAASVSIARVHSGGASLGAPPGAVFGAVAAGVVALAGPAVARQRRRIRPGGPPARLP
jgi:eukaryotic-like serine/threonine-protein kinase